MERRLVGTEDGDFGLTAAELRTLADLTQKVESLYATNDVTLKVEVERLPYEATFGWDASGTFGLLAVFMTDDEGES